MAIDKFLIYAKGRPVCLRQAPDQRETFAKFGMQALGVVSNNGKAATAGRPLQTEGRDDKMSASLKRMIKLADVFLTIVRTGEKMKKGSVIPQVIIE